VANYPTLSKDFDATSFEESSENTVIQPANTEGGYTLTRPKFTRRPRRTFMFKHVDLTETERVSLQNFWDTHKGGSLAFNWTHPVTATVYNVRFDPQMVMKFSRTGYGTNHRYDTDTITLKEV
jgi:phage-related protein